MSIFTKILIFFAVIGIIATSILLFVYGYYNEQIHKKITLDEDSINLTIEKGMGVKEISKLLAEKKLIQYPEILQVYMQLNPDKTLQAGYYTIDTKDMTMISLVEELQKGSFERKLTFLEGWRTEEYIAYLRKQMGDEFADEFAESSFIKEGYLFPDTYIIDKDYEPANLASWMRNTFNKKVTTELIDEAGLKGLSQEEVVILASIVEREMNNKVDRPVVAGILVKRLKSDWALQADATIQYAKGNSSDWWPTVARSDYREFESPYNTYLNKGLPPTPISNPGLDSIKSVVNYKETPYWFYISAPDGKTYYASTLEEHNANVAKYLK